MRIRLLALGGALLVLVAGTRDYTPPATTPTTVAHADSATVAASAVTATSADSATVAGSAYTMKAHHENLLPWSLAVGTGASTNGQSSGSVGNFIDIGTDATNSVTKILSLPHVMTPTDVDSMTVGLRIANVTSGDVAKVPFRIGYNPMTLDVFETGSPASAAVLSDTVWVQPGDGGGTAGAREVGEVSTVTFALSLAASETSMWVTVIKDSTTTGDTYIWEWWAYAWDKD